MGHPVAKIGPVGNGDIFRCVVGEDKTFHVLLKPNETKSITSPGFPGKYTHNFNQLWRIRTAPSYRVKLTFQHFDLESSEKCKADFLAVYEKDVRNSRVICGENLPEPVVSSANVLFINFKTDENVSWKGFEAQVTSVIEDLSLDPSEINQVALTTSGEIASPGFPNYYPDNFTMAWNITAPHHHSIHLRFDEFKLEESFSCGGDHLSVYDGSQPNTPRTLTLCGRGIPQQFQSTSNAILMVLRTDSTWNSKGFKALLTSVPEKLADEVGLNVSTIRFKLKRSANISSPGFPNYYPKNVVKLWNITTEPGFRIKLTFLEFHLQQDFACLSDQLSVYDGNGYTSPRIGNLCGRGLPPTIITKGHNVLLKFKSNAELSFKGFQATLTPICGGDLESQPTPKVLLSHVRYGRRLYKKKQNCEWTLKSPPNRSVELDFESFSVDSSPQLMQANLSRGQTSGVCGRCVLDLSKCGDDYVDVYDGFDDTGILLLRLCGNCVPPVVRSSGDKLFLRFHSGNVTRSTGFKATYRTL